MWRMWGNQTIERPLTSDEISTKMAEMMQERQRQDAEFRAKYAGETSTVVFQTLEKPLSSDEINDRMFQMMQQRAKQDAEFRAKYAEATILAAPNQISMFNEVSARNAADA